tara:strand:+ start:4715 stop:5602 length:888 start_codon:yes stop_codon:yes gene_type:complete
MFGAFNTLMANKKIPLNKAQPFLTNRTSTHSRIAGLGPSDMSTKFDPELHDPAHTLRNTDVRALLMIYAQYEHSKPLIAWVHYKSLAETLGFTNTTIVARLKHLEETYGILETNPETPGLYRLTRLGAAFMESQVSLSDCVARKELYSGENSPEDYTIDKVVDRIVSERLDSFEKRFIELHRSIMAQNFNTYQTARSQSREAISEQILTLLTTFKTEMIEEYEEARRDGRKNAQAGRVESFAVMEKSLTNQFEADREFYQALHTEMSQKAVDHLGEVCANALAEIKEAVNGSGKI